MRPQLHATALQMFARCPEQFRRRYVEGERRPPGIAQAVGSATHAAIERDLRAKMLTGRLIPDDEVAETARDRVAELFAGEIDLAAEAAPKTDLQGQAVDKAVRLARLHHAEVAPTVMPVAVERGFSLDLGLGVDLVGTIDCEADAGEGRANVIRDAKTSARAPDAAAADTSLQLAAYSLAKRTLDGEPASSVVLDYLVDAKTPRLVQIASVVTESREQALLARVRAVDVALKAGVFPPAPPDAWWCSEKFCGYHATCPYVAHSVSVGGSHEPNSSL